MAMEQKNNSVLIRKLRFWIRKNSQALFDTEETFANAMNGRFSICGIEPCAWVREICSGGTPKEG